MAAEPTPRRSFLKTLNYLIGGVIGAALALPALGYALFPVRRKTVEGADDPIPVADLDDIPVDHPIRVPIIAPAQRDGWAAVKNVTLGAVWLKKRDDGSVQALSATCPHLGCSVDWNGESKDFRCPCHTSSFDPQGNRVGGPAKRGMDPLETVVDGKQVSVKFARFRLDTPAREKA